MRITDILLKIVNLILVALAFCSCGGYDRNGTDTERGAKYFKLFTDNDGRRGVAVMSPFGNASDTVIVTSPFNSIVCMSSTSVAGFCAIGAADVVTGVSGMDYISSDEILARRDEILDVGYEPDLDYESILRLNPDIVLAYSSGSELPAYVVKLQSLGIPVVMLYDFLEEHPLARAEYMLLYGALCGREIQADSLFRKVSESYASMAESAKNVESRPGVLMNTPYSDMWYIPGADNYFSTLVEDAGGKVLGSQPGTESSVISLEKAFGLASEAEIWLNPGWCMTRDQIAELHPLISEFPVLKSGKVFNNIKRTSSGGGNDFWESGSVRPDLILKDLVGILHPELLDEPETLEYYIEVK